MSALTRSQYGGALVRSSAASTVASSFVAQVRAQPNRIAADDGVRQFTYSELDDRSRQLAALLAGKGVGRGSRIAILSENRLEYLEAYIAAARLGAILACQNWRLAPPELMHCLDLVEPAAVIVSPRYLESFRDLRWRGPEPIVLDETYEAALGSAGTHDTLEAIDPEEGFLILYTSGTTGLPKGAVISHRAEVARNVVLRADFGIAAKDTFVAWPPLYHMGAAEYSLGTLMSGGKVIVVDGFDPPRLAEIA